MKIMLRIPVVGRRVKTGNSALFRLPCCGKGVWSRGGEDQQPEGTENVTPGMAAVTRTRGYPLGERIPAGAEHRRWVGSRGLRTKKMNTRSRGAAGKERGGGENTGGDQPSPSPAPTPARAPPDTDVLRASLSHMGLIQVE